MKCNKKCMCSQNICLSDEMQQEMYVKSKYNQRNATRNVCVVKIYVYQMKCNKKCMCSQNICLSNEMQQENV